ncbi:MAG: regulatory iron-sulfur-containing complex subunit RicT [Parcubacteria group bacterium]|jgi:cell fate regulator YaaT (PSP1 superfamily)
MNTIFLKIRSWENSINIASAHQFSKGDVVIIENSNGLEAAIVEESVPGGNENPAEVSAENGIKIVRKANLNDLKIIKEHRKKEKEVAEVCRKEAKKTDLPMKIVDAGLSFDGGSITVAFIADGRIDFRELVKNLAKKFQRSIRLYQIGARDESRQCGGYGICGRELCCAKFKGGLPSITSEMAKVQHIAHRGSERISGVCGRLMCCLAYEADQYREMLEEYPPIGTKIKVKGETGIIKEVNVLSDEIKVELEGRNFVIIKKSDLS